VFDAGRILAFAWALALVLRARVWLGVVALASAAYLFGLSVASGFTVRADGPMSPLVAVLLALMGPSAIPRGALPSLPFADAVVHWPALVDIATGAALFLVARRLNARAERLPPFAETTQRLSRAALALVLVAVFQALSGSMRLIPVLLERGAGSLGARSSPPGSRLGIDPQSGGFRRSAGRAPLC
jgi:hypothetical protein